MEINFDFPSQYYFDTISYIPGDRRKALRKADRRRVDVVIFDDDDGGYIARDMDYGFQENLKAIDKDSVKSMAKSLFYKWLKRFPSPPDGR